jgi:hypothetical protein
LQQYLYPKSRVDHAGDEEDVEVADVDGEDFEKDVIQESEDHEDGLDDDRE